MSTNTARHQAISQDYAEAIVRRRAIVRRTQRAVEGAVAAIDNALEDARARHAESMRLTPVPPKPREGP
jgi:hypothetical protein